MNTRIDNNIDVNVLQSVQWTMDVLGNVCNLIFFLNASSIANTLYNFVFILINWEMHFSLFLSDYVYSAAESTLF